MRSRVNDTSATGYLVEHVPRGARRTELLRLVRLGAAFRAQQHGRKPGFLRQYIGALVGRLPQPRTFDALILVLQTEALRREVHGAGASPIERVDLGFELLTYHDPRHGRRQVSLKRIRNVAGLRSPVKA